MARSRHRQLHRTCLGVKRTSPFASHMSAFDPKRTLALPDHPSVLVRCFFLKHRGDDATTGIHQGCYGISSRVAACRARAAAGHAGGRLSRPHIARRGDRRPRARLPSGPAGCGLHRRRERDGRIPLGRQPDRSPVGAGGRVCSPPGGRDRRDRGLHAGVRSQGGNQHHPHRLHRRPGPGQARACRQPRQAGRQPDRRFSARGGDGAAGAPADCRSRSSTPAPAARSMRPSRALGASGPTRSCSGRSRPTGGCNWRCWRRFTRSPRRIPGATLSMPAG